jgi:catechol 2,3-dioxygenase-like lactoylglutathione lyase family enzyme
MPTRFDHLVIGVRDLDAATRHYQHLGFDVRFGGRHTGRGTHNALIRFGLDYIELLSVYDEAEARASGLRGEVILQALRDRDEVFLGYALATAHIEEEADRFRGSELLVDEPFAMHRARPDGHILSWRLFIPGGNSWRRPWPFIIQWDEPDSQRLLLEQPGIHPNGATAWTRAAVAVHDLESAIDLYQRRLGLELVRQDKFTRLSARRATFKIGASNIDLLTPESAGPTQQTLVEIGEGLLEVNLAVKDLHQTRSFLAQRNISFELDAAGPGTLLISPQETPGLRIILTNQNEKPR